MDQKTMLFIFNPKAGMGEIRLNIYEIIELFTRNGFLVTTYPTQYNKDAYEKASRYGHLFDYLVCAGGDGTLNEIVDAMMMLEKKPKLGYIPCGTTNDFATTLGLHKDALLAAQTACDGFPYAVDIGQFEQEYFSYVAAFGLFTDVPYDTNQSMKNLLGHTAYMLEGVKRLGNIKSHHCTIQIDQQTITGNFIFGMVSNSNSIGGFHFSTKTETYLDDGEFEVVLLKKLTKFSQLPEVISMLMGNGNQSDALLTFRASRVQVTADTPLKWTLDGEFGGDHQQVTIHNIPRAIEFIVPGKTDLPTPYYIGN